MHIPEEACDVELFETKAKVGTPEYILPLLIELREGMNGQRYPNKADLTMLTIVILNVELMIEAKSKTV